MNQKRGQFFILAAVILSLVVVSLATVGNYVQVSQEPRKFSKLGQEIRHETGKVVDYSVYQDQDSIENVEQFVADVSENLYDQNPNTEFYFIYGNKSKITVDSSFGKERIYVGGQTPEPGAIETFSTISLSVGSRRIQKEMTDLAYPYKGIDSKKHFDPRIEGVDEIKVSIGENEFKFPLHEGQQIIVLIKKQVKNDTYIDLK